MKLLAKVYVIGWITLSDVIGGLINSVFDLGYEQRDVSLAVVLRNRHVRSAGLPEIVAAHSKAVNYEEYKRVRNDAVHRGRYEDSEIEELQRMHVHVMLASAWRSHRQQQGLPSEGDSAGEWSAYRASVRELAARRAAELRLHIIATGHLVEALAAVLAQQIRLRSSV
ncbi:MAG TPA: Cthe_2314 family HEPN domain-containing protein [Thermoanaerobaculia bacterium]